MTSRQAKFEAKKLASGAFVRVHGINLRPDEWDKWNKVRKQYTTSRACLMALVEQAMEKL